METKINWANDFKYNESLHFVAQELMGTYARLMLNNPINIEYKNWDELSDKWGVYERSIKDLVIDSEELAIQEVETISVELRKAYSLEKKLDNIPSNF